VDARRLFSHGPQFKIEDIALANQVLRRLLFSPAKSSGMSIAIAESSKYSVSIERKAILMKAMGAELQVSEPLGRKRREDPFGTLGINMAALESNTTLDY